MSEPEEPWDRPVVAPFTMAWGVLGEDEVPSIIGEQPSFTLDGAVASFSFKLPSQPSTWAVVADANDQRVLAYLHRPTGEVSWSGCKQAFDLLVGWWSPDEVAWAAAVAQNLHLLDLEG